MPDGGRKIGFVLGLACRLLGRGAGVFAASAACGAAQDATPPDAPVTHDTSNPAGAENNGQDFTRPENLLQLRYQLKSKPGSGSEPGTLREVDSDTATLRAGTRIEFAPQWKLALRTDIPFVATNPITSDNQDGNYLHGLGDMDFQAALIHDFDARWAAGAGIRIFVPTGTDDVGTGKWQAMPVIGARCMLPEISDGSYAVPLVRYDASFAGVRPKRRSATCKSRRLSTSCCRLAGSSHCIRAPTSG